MAVENQTDSMFAGNRHVLRWNGITDLDGSGLKDLTNLIVKFALTRQGENGPLKTPLVDLRSDVGSQITIPNPVAGTPHVEVELLPADTEDLAPIETEYYCELEVFSSSNTLPVVVATLILTIKPNVTNA